jgi:regulator of replication initiation timing
MNEKRFTYDYDEYNGNLFDNKYNTFYPIKDSGENIRLLCKRLNSIIEENKQLKSENKRMTDKLNHLALEFLEYDMVTMGKASEMSEMCYLDFLKYRKENGNPMELEL